ncbi:MAG: YitT family protein [Turicibacter sp.]|nr:YitT family protein [Turicibacter sp.]
MNSKLLKQLALILVGTNIVAFAIINFSVRYTLADGGFAGINLIIFHLTGVDLWISNLALNTPFVFLLFKMSDLKTTLMTVYGIGTLTAALALWRWHWDTFGYLLPYWGDEMLLVIVFYGLMFGIGIGVVVKANGTTGGSVLISKILHQKWGIPVSRTLFVFDLCVISLSLFAFLTVTNAVYTLIGIFISSVVIGKVQEGGLFGYKVLIISDHYEKINHAVRHDLLRGATMIYATGAHSGHDKRILMVVIQKRELSMLKQLIHDIDPTSFVTVTHTYETLGEGFTYEQRMP